MARPAADYKITKDNRSSYNLIAHEHHVPQSPLFGPSAHHMGGSPRRDYEDNRGNNRDYGREREAPQPLSQRQEVEFPRDVRAPNDQIKHEHHVPASPLYRPGGQGGVDPRYGSAQGGRRDWIGGGADYENDPKLAEGKDASLRYSLAKGHDPFRRTIGRINHVPVSPLYRPGQNNYNSYGGLNGSSQGPQIWQRTEVPRPKDPPTPDYNTTQMHIPESNHGDDTKLQLGNLRGSQEDLRDYRQNNGSYQGYQDRPSPRGAPYTDRPAAATDRSYRANPWTQRAKDRQSDLMDPRIGGHYDGMGLVGSRNGGALLFIRFPVGQGENVQVAAHAFLKSKTHDNGGRFLGLAKKVFDFGYEKGPTEAIGVYHFPNMDKAFLFFQMDPIIRQPDFPPPYGHAEMWIVCNAYLPDNLHLFNTFLLSEVELHSGKDKREFFESFQKPFESYLYKNGAMPFVVCSYGSHDRRSLRRHTYPPNSIVTCHLFQGLEHLNWMTNDETYSKFRSLHNQMATEKCSIFTLSKEMPS
ncbi:unnamed protein product [Lymnaea stagnalis]|uniref:Uncharacterized protein n=1 Tax=Lymnaea stagnalis TaxID=6523 RepID=A0AAV2HR01_LYMST